jgi:uncharacterized protein
MGVFAVVDIAEGTRWWSMDLDETITISRTQFAALVESTCTPASEALMAALQEYSIYFKEHDLMVLIPDNGRYVNHADAPNSGAVLDGTLLYSVALRDIAAGEEITEDYSTYDQCDWPGVAPEFHDVTATPELAVTFR